MLSVTELFRDDGAVLRDILPASVAGANIGSASLPFDTIYVGTVVADSIVGAITTLDNAEWLRWRNAADSANINVMRVDASDNTIINADTGNNIQLQVAGVTGWTVDATSILPSVAATHSVGNGSFPLSQVFSNVLRGGTSSLQIQAIHSGSGAINFYTDAGVTRVWRILSSGNLVPETNAGQTFGSSTASLGTVYTRALAPDTGQNLSITIGGTGAAARSGTFVANGATPVVIATTSVTANSIAIFSINTAGGTVGAVPTVSAKTPGTNFSVVATAGDTSTYNWALIERA